MQPITLNGYGHVGIRVHDLATSLTFYEKLGFALVVGPVGPEPVAILSHPAGMEINLILNAPTVTEANVLMDVPEKKAGITHVAFLVGSLDDTRAQLAAAGVELSGEMALPGGAGSVFVRDPDRNVVEFSVPADPALLS